MSTRSRTALGVTTLAAVVATLCFDPFASAAGVVSITPHTLENNVSLASGRSLTPVVSGGSTTVPTDATRVTFSVTVSRAAASGWVAINPWQDASGASFENFTAGSTASGTFTEPVGLQNKVQFTNSSAGSITLTVRITGYSTEVRAGDISPAGGSAGQVLTNTGSGVQWQTPSDAYSEYGGFQNLTASPLSVVSVTLPAGAYVASAMYEAFTYSASGAIECELADPAGNPLPSNRNTYLSSSIPQVSGSMQVLLQTTGGAVQVRCHSTLGTNAIYSITLIASRVGAAHGQVEG